MDQDVWVDAGQGDPVSQRSRGGFFRWHVLASAFLLLQSMAAFSIVDRLAYGEWAAKPGDKLTQSLNLLQIIAGLMLFWRGRRNARALATGAALVVALALFLLATFVWSIDPTTTIRRGVEYLFFALGVIGIACNLDGDEYMDLLRDSCLLSAIISVALIPIVPQSVMMPAGTLEEGELRGIFPHKNLLGEVMAAGVVASLHGIAAGGRRRRSSIVTLVIFTALLFAARSGTAIMASFVLCAAWAVMGMLLRGGAARATAMLLVALLVPVVGAALAFPDILLGLLGKDPTLTGRTILWQYVWAYIYQQPVLGWGLSGFWTPANPAYEQISTAVGWTVPEAHNGLLEMLLEVGVIGTVFLFFLWGRNAVLGLRCLRTQAARNLGISALLCCGALIVFGVSEQVLLDPSHILVNLFFVTGLMCERALATGNNQPWPPDEADRWAGGLPGTDQDPDDQDPDDRYADDQDPDDERELDGQERVANWRVRGEP
jgi:O-antigen ligase